MMNRILAATGLALITACGTGGVADQNAQAQARSGAVRKPLDVAGVTTAMSALDAVRGLQAAGWKVSRDSGKTWDEHVADEASYQRGGSRSGAKTSGQGDILATKGDERVDVTVRPSPRGGTIENVDYSAPLAGRSAEEVSKSLFAKYGPSTTGNANASTFQLKWCAPAGCRAGQSYLTAENGGSAGRLRIALFWGDVDHLAWDREVGRAVAAKAGAARNSF